MPGNVQVSSPSAVLPKNLCSAFSVTQTFPTNISTYGSGEFQAALLVNNARRTWKLSRRLKPADADALFAFYQARGGASEAFWFYDPFDASGAVGSNWDGTGIGNIGRYCVRFQGGFTQSLTGPGPRSSSDFTLVEIA